MLLVPGARLDRYELLCPVAQGGMAAVWLGRVRGAGGHLAQFEKRFALKVILPQHAHDPRFRQMFLDEASIAARLVHTNVAQIVDLGEAQGILYIAMEWVEGDTLVRLARAVHARGQRFPFGIAMRLVAEVASGLHAAHEIRDDGGRLLGVVHRDVSPHNVMVSTQGVAKLIDFGIAKAQGLDQAEHTSSGTLKGKVLFMAPEQAAASTSVDRRADVWALGATLFFLLAGKGPYEGVNEAASLQRLYAGGPRETLPRDTPRAIARIVDRALVHDPAARAQTAAEIHEAMIAAAASDPALAVTDAEVARFLSAHLGARLRERSAAQAKAVRQLDDAEWIETTTVDAATGGRAEDGATLGAAALEAAADARRARTRVALASLVGAAVVAATLGAVAIAKRDSAVAPASAVGSPSPSPSPTPTLAPAPTPTTHSATAASSAPIPSTSTSPSTPARQAVLPPPTAHTATATPPAPAPPAATPAHRDYGF
jgi:hypothetical protein